MKKRFSKVIIAKHLFDGINEKDYEGYLCLSGNHIVEKKAGKPEKDILNQAQEVLNFRDELVMPGITDTHTFFTGYAIYHVGADFSKVTDNEEGCCILRKYEQKRHPEGALLGHGWNPEMWDRQNGEEMLEEKFPNKAVIIFSADRSCCIMNQKARNIYQFSAETCYPESYYRIMREYLNDREFIKKEFSDYMKMMNSRGVTTVKEMGFDDFYGFTDYLKELEDSEDLNLRTFFMSQPVGEGMNLVYARRMREQFTGNKIRFSGFNRMTDGTIASYKGDLKEPYENQDFCCKDPVPYGVYRSKGFGNPWSDWGNSRIIFSDYVTGSGRCAD